MSGATLVVARRIAALGTAVILMGPAPALAQGATLARDSLAARAASAPGRPVAAPDTLAPRLPVVRFQDQLRLRIFRRHHAHR